MIGVKDDFGVEAMFWVKILANSGVVLKVLEDDKGGEEDDDGEPCTTLLG